VVRNVSVPAQVVCTSCGEPIPAAARLFCIHCAARLRRPDSALKPTKSANSTNALEILRTIGARPLLAQTLLIRVTHRGDPDALAEALLIATELGAVDWLEIIDGNQPGAASTPQSG
jgi:hypothetical protein